MARYLSRKFLLALLVVLLATGLRYMGLLDGAQWVTIVGSALLFFNAANVVQKATEKMAEPG